MKDNTLTCSELKKAVKSILLNKHKCTGKRKKDHYPNTAELSSKYRLDEK